MPQVPPSINKLVWVKAAGLCAISECRKRLVLDATSTDPTALVGEIAHIVARSPSGPRRNPSEDVTNENDDANLLLLCPTHHAEIDRHPGTWTAERLRGLKVEHENWVRTRLSLEQSDSDVGPWRNELLHSSLLPVRRMPRWVYVAPCDSDERSTKSRIATQQGSEYVLPFIVRNKKLMSFAVIDESGPFRNAAVVSEVERHDAIGWWKDADLSRWYVALLNRTLNKITGRRGLNLDREHNRYYFEPTKDEAGRPQAKAVSYQPLNNPASTKSVVWRPRRKKTGEQRAYWVHLAIGLRFHRVSEANWVLSLRPERRFTTDGFQPLVPKAVGRRATSLKAHMYNFALLGELQFWKEYLSGGQPHFIVDFGKQSLVIDAELLSCKVDWPGVPGDLRSFENVSREVDLFSSAAIDRALSIDDALDVELDTWEAEELLQMEQMENDEAFREG